ncbi:uncharacterized protein LOC135169379 [Diachasmimorpha longicaudata]|uniref:uncharacterized protein LOC135169379 n=1 Tax=Diachasmimorpha longicaudata TaxID=58733 RepID=UPI0030B8A02F
MGTEDSRIDPGDPQVSHRSTLVAKLSLESVRYLRINIPIDRKIVCNKVTHDIQSLKKGSSGPESTLLDPRKRVDTPKTPREEKKTPEPWKSVTSRVAIQEGRNYINLPNFQVQLR